VSPFEALRPAIICMPGVLQYVDKQFKPLRPVLRRYGDIEYFGYEGTHFQPAMFQTVVAAKVREHLLAGRPVILVGASLGGMQIPYIVARLTDIDFRVVKRLLKVIVIDAPYGAKSLYTIPKWAAWIASKLTLVSVPAWLNNNLGKWILNKMAVPPRRENIDIRYVEDSDAYQRYVIEASLEGLRGHSFSMFVSQLGWMMNAGSSDMPLDILNEIDATYIACIGPNTTVRQPEAVNVWGRYVARVKEVRTAHCAFLEQQEVFLQLVKELLGQPHK